MRLGCDPEVFLINDDGHLKSAIGLIGGNKANPIQVEGLPKGFTLQEDNVSLEFGIPPAKSRAAFVKHIQTVMNAGLNKASGLHFSNLSCAYFPKEELQHPLAHVFGCEPDYNAWTGEKNEKPNPANEALRSAGGHVHIETSLDPDKVGQACDLFLGIPSLLQDHFGAQRRQIYGKGGSIRYKPYGVEYRVLSNYWIFKPTLIRWVWDATALALKWVEEGHKTPDAVEHIINNNDYDFAEYMVKEYNLRVN